MAGATRIELPQGTLDILVLKTLAHEPLHGWGLSLRLKQLSRSALAVRQGSLYPALHRLERRGWIRGRWGVSENGRRARYYDLTARGRAQLASDTASWRRLAAVMTSVLEGS